MESKHPDATGTPILAVVIPYYRVMPAILDVLRQVGPEADRTYCVDDACPDESGRHIEKRCRDPRVK